MRLSINFPYVCVFLCVVSTMHVQGIGSPQQKFETQDEIRACLYAVATFCSDGLDGLKAFFRTKRSLYAIRKRHYHTNKEMRNAISAIFDSVARSMDFNQDGFGFSAIQASVSRVMGSNQDRSPAAVAGAVIGQLDVETIRKIFNHERFNETKKREAVSARLDENPEIVGLKFLEAVEEKVNISARYLSSIEREIFWTLKSEAHGTYLRAREIEWKVDVDFAREQVSISEEWHITYYKGRVVLEHKSGQLLRALANDSVDMSTTHPRADNGTLWKPFSTTETSWSFLSVYGTWLSAFSNGTVLMVADFAKSERFELEAWPEYATFDLD